MEDTTMRKPKASPKDVFMHLLMIGALYTSAMSLIALLFQHVNHFLPDPLSDGDYGSRDAIRWSLSALLVVFPVYGWTVRHLEGEAAKNPEKRQMTIRRWLVNLTLFVSAVTIIVDLVTLIYNYLGGDLTTRFFLKILVVLGVTVVVFAYYIWDLRRETSEIPKKMRYLSRIVLVMIAGVLVGGFITVGSPQAERLRKFDERRVGDLSNLQYQIIDYWQRKSVLPESLDALNVALSGYTNPRDPETGAAYAYHKKGDLVFELCANFATDSSQSADSRYPKYVMPVPMGPRGDTTPQSWNHEAGKKCFARTIDPEFYKTYPENPSPKM